MDSHLILVFAGLVTILMLIPGPNVALIVGTSLAHGARFGLLTVAGTSTAMAVQLALVGAGMAGLLGAAGHWFSWIRWIGAAYLLYLGIMEWRTRPADLNRVRTEARAPRLIFAKAMFVSLTNPKTLLFLAAFLPQFMTGTAGLPGQLATLSVVFVGIAVIVDSGWALLAARLGHAFGGGRLRHRLAGGVMIGAAFGLAGIRDR